MSARCCEQGEDAAVGGLPVTDWGSRGQVEEAESFAVGQTGDHAVAGHCETGGVPAESRGVGGPAGIGRCRGGLGLGRVEPMARQSRAVGNVPEAELLAVLGKGGEPSPLGAERDSTRGAGGELGPRFDVSEYEELNRLVAELDLELGIGVERGRFAEQVQPLRPKVREFRVPDHGRLAQVALAHLGLQLAVAGLHFAHRDQGLAVGDPGLPLLFTRQVAIIDNTDISHGRHRDDGCRRHGCDGRPPRMSACVAPGSSQQADPARSNRLVMEEPLEVLGQFQRRGVAVRLAFRQRFQDDRFQVAGDPPVELTRRGGVAVTDLLHELGCGLPLERGAEREQFVERCPQAIHVGPAVDRSGSRLLRAHVARGAQQAIVMGQARIGQASGEPEVGDPDDPSGVDQEVRRLHVAVDDPTAMRVRERFGRLAPHLGDPAIVGRPDRRVVRGGLIVVAVPAEGTPAAEFAALTHPGDRVVTNPSSRWAGGGRGCRCGRRPGS